MQYKLIIIHYITSVMTVVMRSDLILLRYKEHITYRYVKYGRIVGSKFFLFD